MRAQPATEGVLDNAPIERVLVVVNPAAGGVRRRRHLARDLSRIVGTRGRVAETHDLAALVAAIADARAKSIDTIAICGGDGTNLHVLTAIANAWRSEPWPRIALLPSGSVNTAARNLGPMGPATDRLAALLDGSPTRVMHRPLLRANGRVGFIFGSQMVARVLDTYYAGTTGPVGCAMLGARIIGSAGVGGPLAKFLLAPEDVAIQIDDRDHGRRPVRALMASVVASPAVGLRVTPRAGENDGFHLIATESSPARLFHDLPRFWTGLHSDALCIDEVAREATLTFGSSGRYTLDGELFASRIVRLAATPVVTFLAPG